MDSRKIVQMIGIVILIFPVWLPLMTEHVSNERIAATTEDAIQPIEIEDSIPFTEEKETRIPTFSFEEMQVPTSVGKVLPLVFHADMEVAEAVLILPQEAKIIEEELQPGMTVQQLEDQNHWLVISNIPPQSFSIPVVFEEKGTYDIFIGDTKTTVEIEEDEDIFLDEEITIVTDQENNEIKEDLMATPSEDKVEQESVESSEINLDSTSEMSQVNEEEGIRDVANWEEFIRAFVDSSVTTINVISDFETSDNPRLNITDITTGSTSNPNGGRSYVYLNVSNSSRSVVIEGNNHQIDFRAVTLAFNNTTANASNPWNITLQNLEIYHGNYYGPLTYNDLSTTNEALSTITYHNITNVGNQLIHSPRAKVVLSGETSSKQVASYTSKFRTQNIYATNQTNIEVSKLSILENATIELSTISAGNIDLGGTLAGDFVMEKDATLNAIANGSGGEAAGTNLLIRSGSVYIGENAEVSFTPQINYSSISLRASGASLNIEKKANVKINSTGSTNSTNNNSTNIMWLSAGSTLSVQDGGKLEIIATGQQSTTSNILHAAGAATVNIAKDGILDIQSDSTGQAQNLIYFDNQNSTFTFRDAQEVNLQRTAAITGTATTNGLINIAGSNGLLDVDVQSIKQWNRGNVGETPNYSWIPIFNLNLRYTGVVPRITSVSSISQETMDNFNENFTTQNVQRILFEKIPDVEVTIDPLTEDPDKANSHTITGKANPSSVIRFSGDPIIPEATIDSPSILDNRKYHTITNENGEYSYELPEGDRFTGGSEVVVEAFLNSKFAFGWTIVEERIPVPVDPLDPGIEVIPEDKPDIPENQGLLSLDFVSQFNFGKQLISVQDKFYYAQPQRLLDEDGTVTEEERPNYVQISDRRSVNERDGWQLAVTQNEQFTNENGLELPGASLSFTNQQLATVQGGSEPELQETNTQTLLPGMRSILLKAQENEGTGTWIYRFGDSETASESVILNVPEGTNPEATSYYTTLTWELSAVPGN